MVIMTWPFDKAPIHYRNLSENGGDEDWLTFVPDAIDKDYHIAWLDCSAYGCCCIEKHTVPGGVVYIGCHA